MSPTVGNTARAEVLEQLLGERHSCRAFRADPVPRPTIERILAMAQRTASWCNAQPWQVCVASEEKTEQLRQALGQHMAEFSPRPDFDWPAEYLGIYQLRRRECGLQLYEAVGVERGDRAAGERQRMENFRFFGAPHVAIVTTDRKLGTYGAIDCGAWVAAFMLAARAVGVAAIAQAALAAYPAFWREHLGLGSDRLVVCGVSFGLADDKHPANAFRASRASLGEATQWV